MGANSFLYFSNGDGTIINTSHLVSVHCQVTVATKKDEEEENGYFKEGQSIYSICIVLSQGAQKLLLYAVKERRDKAYNEILAALHPIQIGQNPPLASTQ